MAHHLFNQILTHQIEEAAEEEAVEASEENFANVTLLLHADGSEGQGTTADLGNPSYKAFSDNSSSNSSITVNGDSYGTDFSPYYYDDGYFSVESATQGIAQFALNSNFDFTGDFTIEGWFWANSINLESTKYRTIFYDGIASGSTQIYIDGSNGKLGLYDASAARILSASAVPTEEWVHFAFVRSGNGSNNLSLYINGSRSNQATYTAGLIGSSGTAKIGCYTSGSGRWDGYLSNLKFVKDRAIYSGASITVPTTPFTDPTTSGKLSAYFDNSGDYLQLTDTKFSDFDFGSGQFLIEGWIYYVSQSLGAANTILGQTGWGNTLQLTSGGILQFYQATSTGSSGTFWITGTSALSLNRWTHFAIQRDSSGNLDLWINGTREATNTTYASTAMKFHPAKGDITLRHWNGTTSNNSEYISNFRIKNSAVYTSGASITVPTAPFTSDTNTKLLVCQSKIFKDESSERAITINGNTLISEFSPFNDGYWSNYFDGTNDYLTVPNSTDTNIGAFTEDYTLECWFKLTTITSAHRVLFGMSNGGGAVPKWLIGINMNASAAYASNQVGLYAFGGTSGTGVYSPGFNANQWYHFKLFYTHSNTTTTIDIDGTEVFSIASNLVSSTGAFTIGTDGEFNGDFIGYISNVRLVKGTAIIETVPTSPLTAVTNTVLLTCQSNRFIDNSSSGKTVTVGNNTQVSGDIPFELLSRQTKLITLQSNIIKDIISDRLPLTVLNSPKISTNSPFTVSKTLGPGSGYFDGSGDYLSIDSNAEFAFGTEDFTIEMWVYAVKATEQALYDGRSANGAYPYLLIQGSTGKFIYYVSTGIRITADNTVPLNQWVHLAIARSGTTTKMFVNGIQQSGTYTDSTNYLQAPVVIGQNQPSGGENFEGHIFDLRVVKNKAIYTSNFTPPTSQTVGLRTNPGEVGAYFDGSGDYLLSATSSDFAFGTGNFTFECFAYPHGTGGTQVIMDLRYSNNNNQDNLSALVWNGSAMDCYSGGSHSSGTDIKLNAYAWQHMCVQRSGNNLYFSINGKVSSTAPTFTRNLSGNGKATIGTNEGGVYSPFTGRLHSVRITKGTALYGTSDFDPPTGPLTTTSQGANASEVKLLTCVNNDLTDISTSARQLSRYGDVHSINEHPFDNGYWSFDFDGTGDKIESSGNVVDLDTSSFTIELWFYREGNGASADSIGNTLIIIGASTSSNAVWITVTNDGVVKGYIRYNGSSWETTLTGPTTQTYRWNHVALVKNTSDSDSVKLFVNGFSIAESTNSTDLTTFGQKVGVGGQVGGTRNFNGLISNVRVVKGSALYTTTFTPSTSPLTTTSQGATASEVKLLLHSSQFIDNSGQGNQITGEGNTKTNYKHPFTSTRPQQEKLLTCSGTGAVRNIGFLDDSKYNSLVSRAGDAAMGTFTPFSAPDGYWCTYFDSNTPIEIADSGSGLDLPGDFTVEFFAYETQIAGVNGTTNIIFTVDSLDHFQFGNNGTNVFFYNGGLVFTTTPSPLNQWNHYALVREGGGSNNLSCYRNGTRLTQATNTNGIVVNSMMLGGQDRGGTTGHHGFYGFISNFRIVKGTAVYSGASYTVPTEPLTAITNTSLLTCQSNRHIDNSTNNMTITSYANSTQGSQAYTRIYPYSPFETDNSYKKDTNGGSVFLDGSGDRLEYDPLQFRSIGNGDFTIEVWWYPINTYGDFPAIFSLGTNSSYSNILNIGIHNYASKQFGIAIVSGLANDFTTTNSFKDGQWNHIVLTREGSTLAAYSNGVRLNSVTNTETLGTGQSIAYLGSQWWDGARVLGGYFSGFRAVVGEAVYGSGTSYTVPTAPPTNTNNTTILSNFTNAGIIDHSMNNVIETEGDVRITTETKKFGTGSIKFSSSGDTLKMRHHNFFNFYDKDFTIEFFVRFESSSGYQTIYSQGYTGSGGILMQTNNNVTGIRCFINNSNFRQIANLDLYRWYHIAWSRTNGTAYTFIDGVLDNSGSFTQSATSTSHAEIGSATNGWSGSVSGGPYSFNGFIDEFRITKGLGRYTSDFTPPSQSFANK